MFGVRVWGAQCREEKIVNVTVLLVRVWGGQYREELILNVYCVCCEGLGRAIMRGTDTECYCFCEGLGRAI